MDLLLKSGNPVFAIASYADLQALVARQEFRVVVALRDVSVTWDDQAGTAQVQYLTPDMIPGFTPVRLWSQTGGTWNYQHLWYSRGAGVTRVAHAATPHAATIVLEVKVKLSWLLNAAQAVLTFHLAPWAIVRLRYTLFRSGNSQIEFVGSDIPSQQYFVDWNVVGGHDMSGITSADLAGFITAGNCTDAPVSVKRTVP